LVAKRSFGRLFWLLLVTVFVVTVTVLSVWVWFFEYGNIVFVGVFAIFFVEEVNLQNRSRLNASERLCIMWTYWMAD